MRRVIFMLVGFVIGFVAVAVAGVSLAEIARISQAEGAYMMSVFFGWAPLGGIVGAFAGFLFARPRGGS